MSGGRGNRGGSASSQPSSAQPAAGRVSERETAAWRAGMRRAAELARLEGERGGSADRAAKRIEAAIAAVKP